MKKSSTYLFCAVLLGALQSPVATAQTATASKVFSILQQKCTSCHNSTASLGGLDFTGSEATVYAALFNKTPTNAAAAARGDKLIYPGRPDRSFLFRKLNSDFEPYAKALAANEGTAMPQSGLGAAPFSREEKELLRQWINFAAPAAGVVVSEQLIDDYYNLNGKASFVTPPPAPAASEGFQVKIGPFLIAPGGEVEYYQKMNLDLPLATEVTRIENIMSNYSHHLIVYKYNSTSAANAAQNGLRTQANYTNTTLQTAVQEATDIVLPQGSAFKWAANTAIDMDSHYINYSNTHTYLAEAYINVYTQPSGTAQQEMRTLLVPNTSIVVPADQNPHTFSQPVNYNVGNVYLWGLMGHTHKYGTDYKMYKRNTDGSRGAMLYDAQCSEGMPNCFNPYFDYKHIPLRYFMPFETLSMTANTGLIHDATYLNTGTASVGWGESSNDEMMVAIIMYLTNTTGVIQGTGGINPILASPIKVSPNPAHDRILVQIPEDEGNMNFVIYDLLGREMLRQATNNNASVEVPLRDFPHGIYLYRVIDQAGRVSMAGKLSVD